MYFKVILKKYFNRNQGTYLCQMYTYIIYYMLRRLCFLKTVLMLVNYYVMAISYFYDAMYSQLHTNG